MSGEATLRSLLEAAAATFPDVRATTAGSEKSWSRGDRIFAVLDASSAELRLDVPVATAALKTPDTTASTRGPEWVTFSPTTVDGHAADRLTAWFGFAYRRAAG